MSNTNYKQSIETLELALKSNPFDFDTCLKLITLAGSDESKINELREHAAKYCPTTESFWLTWIHEKKSAAAGLSLEAKKIANSRIFRLYRQAINLVPTADLWVDYLRFIHVQCTGSDVPPSVGASQIRRICEYATKELGLHTYEALKIWAFYRHFERMLLNTLLENTEERIKLEQQVKRIRNLYYRQLPLPLNGRSDLLDGYRLFEAELPEFLKASEKDTKVLEELYQKGNIEWEIRKPYEQDVMNFSNCNGIEDIQKLYEAWVRYINFEKSHNVGQNQLSVYSAYQRACEDLGHLRPDLWQAWGKWVIFYMNDFGRAAVILNRAVRYIPTNSTLWCMLLTCQGHKKSDQYERIRKTFFQAMLGISIDPHPENIPAICFVAADAMTHQWTMSSKPPSVTQSSEPDSENCNILYQSESSDSVGQNEFHHRENSLNYDNASEKLIETPTASDLNGSNILERLPCTFEVPQADKNHDYGTAIRSFYTYGQNRLLAYKSQDSRLSKNFPDNEAFLNDTLKKLWRFWIRIEALTLKNAELVFSLAKKLVGFTDIHLIQDHQIIETSIKQPVTFYAPDWFKVVNSINAVIKTKPEIIIGKSIIEKGLQIIQLTYMQFLYAVIGFEKTHGDSQEVHRLLEQVAHIPVHDLSIGFSSETKKVNIVQNLLDDQPTSIDSLFQLPDTNAVRVTLQQLKSQREKRQRYFSESESETGFSDASSDSSSVKSSLLKSSYLKSKKHRSNTLEPVHSEFDVERTPYSYQNIENSVRATWDGHECTDPSLSPPVAPVSSNMSPIKRKNSSTSITYDSQMSPQKPAKFFDVGMLSSEPEDSHKRIPDQNNDALTKVLHTEDTNVIPTYAAEEDKIMESEVKTVSPKIGHHFLQSKKESNELFGKIKQANTVFVKHLDDMVDEETIRKLFDDCEGLQEIRLIKDFKKRSKGFCYIDFATPEQAANAVEKKKASVLNERQLQISICEASKCIYEPNTAFLSNISLLMLKSANPEVALSSFIETCVLRHLNKFIKVKSIRLRKVKDQYLGYGYADFDSTEDLLDILKLKPDQLVSYFSCKLIVKKKFPNSEVSLKIAPSIPMKQHRWILAPRNKEAKKLEMKRRENEKNTHQPQPKIIFIGRVKSVYICTNPKGRPKGYGFVEFENEKDAFSATTLNDTSLEGREILVSKAYTIPTERKPVIKSTAKRRIKLV